MLCPFCNGSGWDDEHMIKCLHCDNGVVEQTNEEWLDTLSTVDKAIWLSKVAEKLKGNVWMWENWLKAVHKE